MEMGLSLNPLIRLPLSSSRTNEVSVVKHSLTRTSSGQSFQVKRQQLLVVQAKGKKGGGGAAGMAARQFQRNVPQLPKIEDDGNPRFVIFIRMENVYLWYPLNIITGGTTAKIMVAAKNNFLGKYIYKDTLSRNIAAVIYRDEKEIQKTALKQHRSLRSSKGFRYGFKIVEGNNLRAALGTSDVIELPRQEELKTVLDNVKDFFGNAKESFGKITSIGSSSKVSEENSGDQSKEKST